MPARGRPHVMPPKPHPIGKRLQENWIVINNQHGGFHHFDTGRGANGKDMVNSAPPSGCVRAVTVPPMSSMNVFTT